MSVCPSDRSNVDVFSHEEAPAGSSEQTQTVLRRIKSALTRNNAVRGPAAGTKNFCVFSSETPKSRFGSSEFQLDSQSRTLGGTRATAGSDKSHKQNFRTLDEV